MTPPRPRPLTRDILLGIRCALLAEHGGERGVRDEEALAAVLDRPMPADPDGLPDLAAAYACRLVDRRPFPDGNAAVALAALDVCLRLHGRRLETPPLIAATTIRDVEAGTLDEAGLAAFVRHAMRT